MTSLEDLAEAIDEALSIVKRLTISVSDYQGRTGQSLVRLNDLLIRANDLATSQREARTVSDQLLFALIGEMVKAGGVDGAALSERFQSLVRAPGLSLSPSKLAHAKHIADLLSQPGFPDDLPAPRGPGPMLIVDNELPDP